MTCNAYTFCTNLYKISLADLNMMTLVSSASILVCAKYDYSEIVLVLNMIILVLIIWNQCHLGCSVPANVPDSLR